MTINELKEGLMWKSSAGMFYTLLEIGEIASIISYHSKNIPYSFQTTMKNMDIISGFEKGIFYQIGCY